MNIHRAQLRFAAAPDNQLINANHTTSMPPQYLLNTSSPPHLLNASSMPPQCLLNESSSRLIQLRCKFTMNIQVFAYFSAKKTKINFAYLNEDKLHELQNCTYLQASIGQKKIHYNIMAESMANMDVQFMQSMVGLQR